MLFDTSPNERLVGIAKLAAESAPLGAKRRVEYRELPTRRYITRCQSDRVPFQWTINPYRGCEFGCVYCYARYTHEFMELREPFDFETRIFAKAWSAPAFRAELRRIPETDWIGIGTATDPYQPAERRFRLTRRIVEILAGERRRRFSLTTKSDLVTRDTALLATVSRSNVLHIGVSITTMDADLARLIEPYAPRPDLRMEAVRRLAEAGIQVGVLACPLLPLINDDEAALDKLARAAADAGATSFAGGVVFLKPCTHRVIFPFLDEKFPHLAGRYRRYFERRSFLGGAYPEKIQERLTRVRDRHHLARRYPEYRPTDWAPAPQLELDFDPPRRPAHIDSAKESTCRLYAVSL